MNYRRFAELLSEKDRVVFENRLKQRGGLNDL